LDFSDVLQKTGETAAQDERRRVLDVAGNARGEQRDLVEWAWSIARLAAAT
jgi:hypothetical protein